MGSIYYRTLISGILLFPWSLVGLMIVGTVWERAKVRVRIRNRS
ncbi:MAG: hypothetical protein ACE5IQ_12625 [Candidatus Methylomirabilales bacterium]